MDQLILHHHDPSPFAEKIRLVFGLKQLPWASVQVPMIMPKPDLTALTGGYRKAPVLQVGADIFCDTALIARELEQRFPTPSLFGKGASGLAYAIGRWSDQAMFNPGAGLSMGENPEIPEPILADRKAFFNFMDFDRMAEAMPHCYAQFQAQSQLLEDELSDRESTYLVGDRPGWLDVQAYFCIWMIQGNVPRAEEILAPFPTIRSWAKQMTKIGHGERTDIDSNAALKIASQSQPIGQGGVEPNPFHQFQHGDAVTVAPDDYGIDPVVGSLQSLDRYRVSIERQTESLGRVHVHFPRTGYRVAAA